MDDTLPAHARGCANRHGPGPVAGRARHGPRRASARTLGVCPSPRDPTPPPSSRAGDTDGAATAKRVLLAKPRGYCAGVDRAVVAVEKALETYGPPVYVRKEIVHNRHVVTTLAERGAVFVEETDEVPEGATVVFSAHGVSPAVHSEARARELRTIDATCPLVTKVHQEAKRFARDDYDILLIGHEGHEEVEGTSGEAPENIQVVDGPAAVDAVEVRDPDKVIWLSQTTLSVDETMQTVSALRERFPALSDPPSDDICYATQNRQVAVKAMAPAVRPRRRGRVDELLELGAPGRGRPAGRGAGLAPRRPRGRDRRGAGSRVRRRSGSPAGRRCPEILVGDVLHWLADRGYGEVEEITTANEKLTFSLPRELKRDMRPDAVR